MKKTSLELYDNELNRHFSYFICGAITLQGFKSAMAETYERCKKLQKHEMTCFANTYADAVMAGCLETSDAFFESEYGGPK